MVKIICQYWPAPGWCEGWDVRSLYRSIRNFKIIQNNFFQKKVKIVVEIKKTPFYHKQHLFLTPLHNFVKRKEFLVQGKLKL